MNIMQKPNPVRRLTEAGQSVWLDFIRRGFISDGSLQRLIDEDGIGGITSNPAIFQKAMGEGTDYDSSFKPLAQKAGSDALSIYESLAIEDIQHAADLLRPVYERTEAVDGYVSLEVSPYLALQTEDTIVEARRLWKAVGRPNLMIKVPGTKEGVPAFRQLIEEGINVNVTLLFALDAYRDIAEAYVAALEARRAKGEEIHRLASVASFFVSRIDTIMDKRIDERVKAGETALKALRGKIAIANAKVAYQHYLGLVASDRWKRLAGAGARPQRLLWASTGTKDKAYSDVLYVEELIGPDTVDTVPPATLDAFRDHGRVRESLTEDVDGARRILERAEEAGLDLGGATDELVQDGVRLFADAADALLASVAAKRAALAGDRLARVEMQLPGDLGKAMDETLDAWRRDGSLRRLWAGDATLWTGGDEAKWLAWLRAPEAGLAMLDRLRAFRQEVDRDGFRTVLLLGMGGSSLGPEVLGETFGHRQGFPELVVLDSTDPEQVAHIRRRIEPAKTLVIVSSKSGGTLEPNILFAYFWKEMRDAVGDAAGRHFVAITDPGSHMEAVAREHGFRDVFHGDPGIGGRYSVLSPFGLVPAAALGVSLAVFLAGAQLMARSCAPGTPPVANPGARLGALLGVAAREGRDKLTAVASPPIADLGAWLEQLLAESTGKQSHGIVPVDDEPLGPPEVYGQDRVFAYLRLADRPDPAQDAAVQKLADAGQPVVRVLLPNSMAVGQAFFLWEFATAVAGAIIGINPFDQPDVEASKVETRKLTDAYAAEGHLPSERPFLQDDGLQLFADEKNAVVLQDAGSVDAAIKAHLDRLKLGDYAALLPYLERDEAHVALFRDARTRIRDAKRVATCVGFGPRFLHSTGQAYKGGPNSGVFVQVTADHPQDIPVPGEKYSFGVVEAAQARGDFAVLAERGRRALRVHVTGDLEAGLKRLAQTLGRAQE
jgi:transaldolase / glucose-6-phosphate isomerase